MPKCNLDSSDYQSNLIEALVRKKARNKRETVIMTLVREVSNRSENFFTLGGNKNLERECVETQPTQQTAILARGFGN